MFKACIGLNCARQIDFIDRRHCSLLLVPDEVYRHRETLEELLLDFNSIQDLPPKFFNLTNLRRLTISENDLLRMPPGVANLTRLVELDLSKNALEDIQNNLQFCRSLSILDISSNPIIRVPEVVGSIPSLTQLSLNDLAIQRLPKDIGNLTNLRTLEARENLIKTLPMSIGSLKKLRRLDLGNNEIDLLPEELGDLVELTELWLDTNCLEQLPEGISNLRNLSVLDVTKNQIKRLPVNFASLSSLSDLHLSENSLEALPEDVGRMKALTLVKLDLNIIMELPNSIGELRNLRELVVFDNMLSQLPPSLFQISTLEMLNVDRNHITELPHTVGECKSLHVLSLRENEVMDLPPSLGQLTMLRVLDVVGNRLRSLPLELSTLNLDALWIDGSQPQPLVGLQPEQDQRGSPEKTRLTCMFLPQTGPHSPSMENFLAAGSSEDMFSASSLSRTGSFSKGTKLSVAFDPVFAPPGMDDYPSKFVRFPTPRRKDLKARRKRKFKPDATPSTTIFRKGTSSQDDLTLLSTSANSPDPALSSDRIGGNGIEELSQSPSQFSGTLQFGEGVNDRSTAKVRGVGFTSDTEEPHKSSLVRKITPYGRSGRKEPRISEEDEGGGVKLSKMSGVENLSSEALAGGGMDLVQSTPKSIVDFTPDLLKNAVPLSFSPESATADASQLQTIEVVVEIEKLPNRSLGFSIAGGRGSTPAYEDVDESIFITKIAPGGLAEQDGRLRLGDKLVLVNGVDMAEATHAEAVAALKSVTDVCQMTVSREVLVVMPDEEEEEEEGEGEHVSIASASALPAPQLTFDPAPETIPPPTPPPTTTAADDSASELFARKIVAEILDKSVVRYHSEMDLLNGAATSAEVGGARAEVGEERGEGGREETDATGNYVNYDIAQTLLEKATRQSLSPPAEEESPLRGVRGVEPSRDVSPGPAHSFSSEDSLGGYPEERVVLDRSIGLLGLSVVGGADHVSRVFGQGRPGVYISKIARGGAAAATGKLRLGDRILEVNGHNVRHSTHQQAVQWLISTKGDIELHVQHVPQPPGLMEVLLEKAPQEKLGISIRGGGKASKGNPLDHEDEGIFISKITKGGTAERDRRLTVGHRLLEVNGISLLGASHIEAVKALRSSPDRLIIIVCHGYDPREVVLKKAAVAERASLQATPSLSLTINSLDDDVHRLLCESMDGGLPQRSLSAVVPRGFAIPSLLSRSVTAIDEPVTAEDLDVVLRKLAKFREIETRPVEPVMEEEPLQSEPLQSEPIPLSDLLSPLQSDLGLISEDLPDVGSAVVTQKETEEKEGALVSSPSLEQELAAVNLDQDTDSMLAALNNDIMQMQDALSREEEQTAAQPTPEEKKGVGSRPRRYRLTRGSSSASSEPKEPSPETVRRASQLEIRIDPPEERHHTTVQAVQSIIGEVFDGVSFEEFERPLPRSGSLTPISGDLRRSESPQPATADFQELLSALQGLGEKEEEEEVANTAPVVEAPVAAVPAVTVETKPPEPTVKFAAEPRVAIVTGGSPVMLRPESTKTDPSKRRSAPPRVLEKTFISPEKLTFREKLALHKKAAAAESSSLTEHQDSAGDGRGSTGERRGSGARELGGVKKPSAVVADSLAIKRTASDETASPRKPAAAASQQPPEETPVSLSDRIALLRRSQMKAGMEPIVMRRSGSLSSEEKRLAKKLSPLHRHSFTPDGEIQSSRAPQEVISSGSPASLAGADSLPSPPPPTSDPTSPSSSSHQPPASTAEVDVITEGGSIWNASATVAVDDSQTPGEGDDGGSPSRQDFNGESEGGDNDRDNTSNDDVNVNSDDDNVGDKCASGTHVSHGGVDFDAIPNDQLQV